VDPGRVPTTAGSSSAKTRKLTRARICYSVTRFHWQKTDAFESMAARGPFLAHCDECGEGHSYEPPEVLRLELKVPEGFATHPRYR